MGYGSADYLHTVTEAMKLAYADRDTTTPIPRSSGAGAGAALEGVCEGARGADRSGARLEDVHRRRSAEVRPAGQDVDRSGRRTSPTAPESNDAARSRRQDHDADASLGLDSAGVIKDTTHIAVVDKDGNIFD